MTVKELIAVLAELPDDMPVILSKDAEGNYHGPLSDVSVAMYEPESRWSGYVLAEVDEADDSDRAYKAAVLWPIN